MTTCLTGGHDFFRGNNVNELVTTSDLIRSISTDLK